MKLVFIIGNNRVIGGGEYAQFKYAQYLARMNHQVFMYCGDKHFLTKDLSREKNLEVYYKPTIPVIVKRIGIGKLNSIWSRFYEKIVVQNHIKKKQPDWIIGYSRESSIQAVRLGIKNTIPVANLVFETPPWMQRVLGKRWQEEWRYKKFRELWEKTRTAYQQSTVLIPNSKLSRSEFEKWLPNADISEPVYPGVDIIKKKNKKKKYDIIYIGRLSPLKNVVDMFYAVEMLKKNSISIVVIGSGEQEQYLKKLAKQLQLRVLFTGSVSDEEKFNYLSKSKLMVFPSSFEGFGMPPLEALATGCQVICSDIPIFREIYEYSVHYFSLHNIDELSVLIDGILSGIISKKIDYSIISRYKWEQSAKTIELILKDKNEHLHISS